MAEEETSIEIYGDLLDTVISHVPIIDLLPAYHVSKDWRRAVLWSASKSSRAKPWLIAHIQSRKNPSFLVTHAYDPESHLWIELPRAITHTSSSPLRLSSSNFLYTLTPSKLSFSLDPLNAKWQDVNGPKVCRLDPIVAIIGSDIVVAGGTYDFEDDPLSVEIYNTKSRKWEMCQSMPDILKDSAFTTWTSVAVSEKIMFLLEKSSGTICAFDTTTKSWGDVVVLRPNPSIFFSLIGFVNDRLILVGLLGSIDSVESLGIWEVNCENAFPCSEIGRMPSKMLKQLIGSCETPSSVSISTTNDFFYIYNESGPKEVVVCEISNSSCRWGSVPSLFVDEDDCVAHRFVFNSSKVGFGDVQKAFGKCARK